MQNLDLALQVTGKFEGHDLFGSISGNFDGMGVSAGVLQWNFGMGSLQMKILADYMKAHDDLDSRFPEPISHLVLRGTNAEDVDWVDSHMLIGDSLKPTWHVAWRKFMSSPEVVEIQKKWCGDVSERAEKLAKSFGFDSVRSYLWAFDVITQNGSMKGVTAPIPSKSEMRRLLLSGLGNLDSNMKKNRDLWLSLVGNLTAEAITLWLASYRRAKLANPRWFNDVMQRKGTLATGVGYVHGSLVDLRKEYSSPLLIA